MCKKILSLVLAVVLCIGLFSGCSKNDIKEEGEKTSTDSQIGTSKEEGTTTTNETKEEDATNALIEKYRPDPNKRYSFTWTGYQMAPIDENPEMAAYWGEKFNVDIDIWNIEDDKQLKLKFASREIPDRMEVSQEKLPSYIKQGLVAEIPEEVLKYYAPTLYKIMEEEAPGLIERKKIDGKIYGLTSDFEMRFRTPIVVRGDWMANVGVTKEPETLNEFEELMYKFAKEDPDQNGRNDTYGLSKSAIDAVYGAYGYGDMWFNRDGKAVYGFVQPEMKEALAKLAKWYKDGVLDPEFITGENSGGYWAISHSFAQGRIGTTMKANYYHWNPNPQEDGTYKHNIGELQKYSPEVVNQLVFINPPIGPNGERGTKKGTNYSSKNTVFGIGLQDDPGKLGKMLQITEAICSSDIDTFNTANSGIKGKHWNYDENDLVKLAEGVDLKSQSSMGAHVIMTNVRQRRFLEANLPEESKWVYTEELDKYYLDKVITDMPPFDARDKYNEELKKIQKEAYIKIITGEEDVDYFDEFVKAWYKSGGQKFEDEVNEWYATINQ